MGKSAGVKSYLERSADLSAETCVVSCSGNYNNLGTVNSCNNEIYDILEYY